MSSRVNSGGSITSGSSTEISRIEADKENIQPLKQGRSANNLVKALSLNKETRKEVLARERDQFEASLDPARLEDLDDPLEPYLKYLDWIHTHYPSGASTESGLIQLLERITHDFRDDEYYKNEVRYFKVWLEYVKFSDNPRDIFQYLYKKKIGLSLSLLYESFANFMELEQDFLKAEELYQAGISAKARPLNRLIRAYENFKIRRAQCSRVQKRQGLGVLHNPSGGGLQVVTKPGPSRSSKAFAVFNDAESKPSSATEGIWQHLDTIDNSKKENVIRPTSWSGEKLIQQRAPRAKEPTFEVFKDNELHFPVCKIIHNPGKRIEKFDFNFDLLYPDGEDERSLMEVLLLSRGVYYLAKKRKSEHSSGTPSKKLTLSTDAENETKLLNSPTLTFYSRQSMKEVLQMLNQPLKETTVHDEEPPLDEGLSDFITETITNHTPATPIKTTNEDTGVMSSPFLEEPLHSDPGKGDVLINPFDHNLQKNLLYKQSSHLSSYDNYHHSTAKREKYNILRSLLKPRAAPIMGSRQLMIEFESETFCFTKQLGNPDKAATYLSEKSDGTASAIKVYSPPVEWEYYILKQLEVRTPGNFIKVIDFYKFEDESYLILPYLKHGTLWDLIQLTSQSKSIKLEESMVIYLTAQLLKQTSLLHSIRIVHANLKAENCILGLSPSTKPSYHDLKLIDFQNSVDLSLFPDNVRFSAQLPSGTCPSDEVWNSWRHEPDYYGLANIVHMLLFGRELGGLRTSSNMKIRENMPSYWQKELWSELFKVLLNAPNLDCEQGVPLRLLASKFENWVNLNWSSCGLSKQLAKITDFMDDQRKRNKI
ncbi:hypothetical protein KL933_005116 [Ogataea haglerorum]|uniref:Uncharacterized protein n=1 Tax=Ogataea haglerorum TaxID=1937702 RepID=A0AAN6HY66_9ASCO|nr:hypothetical protein KL950_005283 [Ogataea haglerorum]KAG7723973.1 hypothetical protein KL933_005116 [Ogataea haglerorum]KAG7724621.1 hypothetical protein KL948_005185 [Ogataea haglerorum]KAG7733470.1 hypothetical protein KL932_005251 [Ogataea haglerorum]KAG7735962.1 hypothetical protein KL923_005242 [Ogataea haglerorum]